MVYITIQRTNMPSPDFLLKQTVSASPELTGITVELNGYSSTTKFTEPIVFPNGEKIVIILEDVGGPCPPPYNKQKGG